MHFGKARIVQNPLNAARFNVMRVPTLMIFKNGKLQWRQAGMQSKAMLKNVLATIQ